MLDPHRPTKGFKPKQKARNQEGQQRWLVEDALADANPEGGLF